MSLNKAINHGKEHRKPYTGSKAIDRTCRNHQGCPWCEENRLHKFRDKHPGEKEEALTNEASGDDCKGESYQRAGVHCTATAEWNVRWVRVFQAI